jgi:hypothetical protein
MRRGSGGRFFREVTSVSFLGRLLALKKEDFSPCRARDDIRAIGQITARLLATYLNCTSLITSYCDPTDDK